MFPFGIKYMTEKTKLPIQSNTIRATDLATLAAQQDSLKGIGRQIGELASRTDAIQDIGKHLTRYADIGKHFSELTKAGPGQVALNDLVKKIGIDFPKVNLNLPDISRHIQVSLPRPLNLPDVPGKGAPEGIPARDAVTSRPGDAKSFPSDLPLKPIRSASDLGQIIRRVRDSRNLSQQDFADLAGVGRRFLSELENGKPTLEFSKVLKVASAAGVTLFVNDH